MHIFPPLVNSMNIFPTIDLKFTKLQKKADKFSTAAHTPSISFFWGKNINQEGRKGGGAQI